MRAATGHKEVLFCWFETNGIQRRQRVGLLLGHGHELQQKVAIVPENRTGLNCDAGTIGQD